MDILEIIFERQWEYDRVVHFILFNIFLEKIMQKALIQVNSSENDCFVDDTVEDSEETNTPLSSVSIGGRPLCNFEVYR